MRIEVIASGSRGNCYYVSDGLTPLLLECGVTRKRISAALQSLGAARPDFCLISHEHKDHCRAYRELATLGIPTFMSGGTAYALGITDTSCILPLCMPTRVATWQVTTFAVTHDAQEPVGFLLDSMKGGRLFYVTDTQAIKVTATGITHLMIEANYTLPLMKGNVASGTVPQEVKDRVLWNHQSLETAMNYMARLDRSRLQAVYLLHLSDANADEEAFKREVQAVVGVPVHVA